MDFSKMLKEKMCSYLNFTGTPHVADPYVFVALRFSSGRNEWLSTMGLHHWQCRDGGAQY
jgi:hypothetical protein